MLNRTLSTVALSALAFGGLVTLGAVPPARAQTASVIIAPSAPPPPRVEVVPAAPDNSPQVMAWHPGHWAWGDGQWEWTAGHYVARPQPAAVWAPGHWDVSSSGGYVWVEGHWQS